MVVVQLSAAVLALPAKAGAPFPFYLEWQQRGTSQCTAEKHMKYQVPQWDSYFLGSAGYSTKDFSGLFSRCMNVSEVQLKKYFKGMWKWLTGLDTTDRRPQSCLHLGLTMLWCFIIVFKLVVRPIAVWSHWCSGPNLILSWSPSLNWIGPNCALWLEVKVWPPSFYTPPAPFCCAKWVKYISRSRWLGVS